MMERLLPRLQLVLAVLFAGFSLCGPLFFVQAEQVILFTITAGILLGLATFFIGWQLAVKKQAVTYPFWEWSAAILRPFLSLKQSRALRPAGREMSRGVRRVLGFFSLAAGALLVIGMLIMAYLIFGRT